MTNAEIESFVVLLTSIASQWNDFSGAYRTQLSTVFVSGRCVILRRWLRRTLKIGEIVTSCSARRSLLVRDDRTTVSKMKQRSR